MRKPVIVAFHCGACVDLAVGHQQASEDVEQISQQAATPRAAEQRREKEIKLLAAVKDALPRLKRLRKQANSHWGYEGSVYRFHHGSFKVYHLPGRTAEIVTALPDVTWSLQVIRGGVPCGHSLANDGAIQRSCRARWTLTSAPGRAAETSSPRHRVPAPNRDPRRDWGE